MLTDSPHTEVRVDKVATNVSYEIKYDRHRVAFILLGVSVTKRSTHGVHRFAILSATTFAATGCSAKPNISPPGCATSRLAACCSDTHAVNQQNFVVTATSLEGSKN